MREVVLDTETTGFDPVQGDRIVEIGAVELNNHLPTGRTYHQYINPMRDMPASAFEVHGLSTEFLSDKPVFQDIAAQFLEFIADSPLVIHNASFDMKFINHELVNIGLKSLPTGRAIDTLMIARAKYPGSPASLDALCRRFGVDSSAREKHGALLDSQILAEVYLQLVGGRQPNLVLEGQTATPTSQSEAAQSKPAMHRPRPLPNRLSDEEIANHQAFIARMTERAIWPQRGGV
jgi:DNA polymerase-3 subunit epsilon